MKPFLMSINRTTHLKILHPSSSPPIATLPNWTDRISCTKNERAKLRLKGPGVCKAISPSLHIQDRRLILTVGCSAVARLHGLSTAFAAISDLPIIILSEGQGGKPKCQIKRIPGNLFVDFLTSGRVSSNDSDLS
jgi:hypothetical protein